jgi:hypothetical protein
VSTKWQALSKNQLYLENDAVIPLILKLYRSDIELRIPR